MSGGIRQNHLEIFLWIGLEKNSLLSHTGQGRRSGGNAVICPGSNIFLIFNVSESCSLCGLGVAVAPEPVCVGTHAPLPHSLGLISAPCSYCYGNEPGKLFELARKRGTFIKERANQGHSVKSGKNREERSENLN